MLSVEVIQPGAACHVVLFSQSRMLLTSIYFRLSFIQFVWFTEARLVKTYFQTYLPYRKTKVESGSAQVQESKLLAPHVGCFANVLNLVCHSALKVKTVSRLLGRASTTARQLLPCQKSISCHSCLDINWSWMLPSGGSLLMIWLNATWSSRLRWWQCWPRVTLGAMPGTSAPPQWWWHHQPGGVSDCTQAFVHCPTISLVLPLKDKLLATLPPQAQDSALVSAVKLAIIGNLSGRSATLLVAGIRFGSLFQDPDNPDPRQEAYGVCISGKPCHQWY